MAPVDPDLVELLQVSADRSVRIMDALRDDVAALRRVLDNDREAAIDRLERLERQVDRYGKTLGDFAGELKRVDARCAALVVEPVDKDGNPLIDDDGQPIIRARAARIGWDWKLVLMALVTLVAAALTSPALVELVR